MNNIKILGIVKNTFKFLYEYENERFYICYLESVRTSGNIDTLPLVSSENVADLEKINVGDVIEVVGEVRTRNDNGKVRVFIFSSDININVNGSDTNEVVCDGYVCKPPIYRTTPFGREITDLIIVQVLEDMVQIFYRVFRGVEWLNMHVLLTWAIKLVLLVDFKAESIVKEWLMKYQLLKSQIIQIIEEAEDLETLYLLLALLAELEEN